MRKREMRIAAAISALAILIFSNEAIAGLGNADFPKSVINSGPKSDHEAWCLRERNQCRVLFRGPALWVVGEGGILSDQYISFRYDRRRGEHSHEHLFFNYLEYEDSHGDNRVALFIFANGDAQRDFARALFLWKRQTAPNELKDKIPALREFEAQQ